jgi:hypothetical protein
VRVRADPGERPLGHDGAIVQHAVAADPLVQHPDVRQAAGQEVGPASTVVTKPSVMESPSATIDAARHRRISIRRT